MLAHLDSGEAWILASISKGFQKAMHFNLHERFGKLCESYSFESVCMKYLFLEISSVLTSWGCPGNETSGCAFIPKASFFLTEENE